jgi:hypothetical protein
VELEKAHSVKEGEEIIWIYPSTFSTAVFPFSSRLLLSFFSFTHYPTVFSFAHVNSFIRLLQAKKMALCAHVLKELSIINFKRDYLHCEVSIYLSIREFGIPSSVSGLRMNVEVYSGNPVFLCAATGTDGYNKIKRVLK